MCLISIIAPCYNESEVLPFFHEKILEVTDKMTAEVATNGGASAAEGGANISFEFIFVNDGSRDNTLHILKNYAESDARFKFISFSRNFGKESAIYAGLQHASGDFVVLLDADLQHPPELIPQMYELVAGGEFDCAATRRVSREGDSKILSFFSESFYRVINSISKTRIVSGAQDFRFMTRQMVDAILSMTEYGRFSKGIFSWVGFDTKFIEVGNTERKAGKSKWNFWKLFSYSIDGITGFSTAPLRLASILGVLSLLASVVCAVVFIVISVMNSAPSAIYAGICLQLFIGGIILLCIGILGEYLSKTYLESKHRPVYIVKETNIQK